MPIVHEDLDLPGSDTPPTEVTIELGGVDCRPFAGTILPSTLVIGRKVLRPGMGIDPVTGYWEINLVGNDDITPSGTGYRVTRRTVDGSVHVTCISVPVTGGPYAVASLDIAPPGSIPASELAPVNARLGILETEAVNVQSFGATGNGVADDTAEIQAAINAAPANARVVFPPGVYLVSAPIVLRGGLTYEGLGHGPSQAAIIRQANGANISHASNTTGILVAAAWANDSATCDNPIAIRNLNIDGNRANNPTSDASCILLCSFRSVIEDCLIDNAPVHGILLTDVTADGTTIGNSASENRIRNNTIRSPGQSCFRQISQDTIAHLDGYLTGNAMEGGVDSIHLQRAAGWMIDSNHTYANTGNGIVVDIGYATWIQNNYVERFGQAAANGVFYAGISVTQLTGRATHILNNFVGSEEPSDLVGAYAYISATASSGETGAEVFVSGNHCQGPAVPTTKGRGLVLTGNVSGSVLHAHHNANRSHQLNTPVFIDAGVRTYRDDSRLVEHVDLGATATRFIGSNAGTSPPPVGGSGTDMAGTITWGTGTGASAGEQVGVDYQTDYLTPPRVIVVPANPATVPLGVHVLDTGGTGSEVWGFVVRAASAPASSQPSGTYAVHYIVESV